MQAEPVPFAPDETDDLSAPAVTATPDPGPAARLEDWRMRVERELDRWLPAADLVPERLHAALRYSVLGARQAHAARARLRDRRALGVARRASTAPPARSN